MLRSKFRITKDKEFSEFFGARFKSNKGRNFSSPGFVVKTFVNKEEHPRFGIMVSNKVDKRAVKRNQIRRQIRELIRLNLERVDQNIDCLIIVQPSVTKLTKDELQGELKGLFAKAKIL